MFWACQNYIFLVKDYVEEPAWKSHYLDKLSSWNNLDAGCSKARKCIRSSWNCGQSAVLRVRHNLFPIWIWDSASSIDLHSKWFPESIMRCECESLATLGLLNPFALDAEGTCWHQRAFPSSAGIPCGRRRIFSASMLWTSPPYGPIDIL